MQHDTTLRQTLTNESNGRSVTEWHRTIEKDLTVTDNADGRSTNPHPGHGQRTTVYGSERQGHREGTPARCGSRSSSIYGGTPPDPSDDEFLEFLGFWSRDSTGRFRRLLHRSGRRPHLTYPGAASNAPPPPVGGGGRWAQPLRQRPLRHTEPSAAAWVTLSHNTGVNELA